MVYALTIAVVAGLAMLALPLAGYALAQRAKGERVSFSGWSFRPNALALTIIAVLVAAALWRFFPGFLFLPFLIPFFWRFRRGGGGGGGDDGGSRRPMPGGPFVWQWRRRHEPKPGNGHSKEDERERDESRFRNLN
jgi:hypothetical protein